MNFKLTLILIFILITLLVIVRASNKNRIGSFNNTRASNKMMDNSANPEEEPHPLSIEVFRKNNYPGSGIKIEKELSGKLNQKFEKENKDVEFYTYNTPDHNLGNPNFEIAMKRTVDFYDKYLKNERQIVINYS